MKVGIPVLYRDLGERGDAPVMVCVFDEATIEPSGDRRFVKIILSNGKEWAVLPADLFSDKVLSG
jgi:hypothetical protein